MHQERFAPAPYATGLFRHVVLTCVHLNTAFTLDFEIIGILSVQEQNQFLFDLKTFRKGSHTDRWLSQGVWWSAYRFMHFC